MKQVVFLIAVVGSTGAASAFDVEALDQCLLRQAEAGCPIERDAETGKPHVGVKTPCLANEVFACARGEDPDGCLAELNEHIQDRTDAASASTPLDRLAAARSRDDGYWDDLFTVFETMNEDVETQINCQAIATGQLGVDLTDAQQSAFCQGVIASVRHGIATTRLCVVEHIEGTQ